MISGESVDATGHKPHEAGNPAGWCRFSNTCYMVSKPYREVKPEWSVGESVKDMYPYMTGCPQDESKCKSAQTVLGNVKWFEQVACLECGKLFDPPGLYCSEECKRKAVSKPRRCIMCGAEFMSTNVLRRTCSHECACEYKKLKTQEKGKLNQLLREGKR